VDQSTVVLEREKHRLIHEGDWRRWGSRGGRETLRRYGHGWFVLLARRRWGRISPEELEAARVPPVRRVAQGEAIGVRGPNVASKPSRIAFEERRRQ
jgi:hypothetical protein